MLTGSARLDGARRVGPMSRRSIRRKFRFESVVALKTSNTVSVTAPQDTDAPSASHAGWRAIPER